MQLLCICIYIYIYSFIVAIHDLECEDAKNSTTTTSCVYSPSSIVDVDSGNSSSHSPSPDDTCRSISAQNCQNRPSTQLNVANLHCRNGSKNDLSKASSSVEGKMSHTIYFLLSVKRFTQIPSVKIKNMM